MELADWFGLAGIVAVIAGSIAAGWAAHYAARRGGRQKIAEARLGWGDRYRLLALDLSETLLELERLDRKGRLSLRRSKLEMSAKRHASELLLMTNPDSKDAAAPDEAEMENQLMHRLANLGLDLDMGWVRSHRSVLKHNWRRAKEEF